MMYKTSNINLVLEQENCLINAGISILPIAPDGSKAPHWQLLPRIPEMNNKPSWKPYQNRLPTQRELHQWFGSETLTGIVAIAGSISKGLKAIDIDCPTIAKQFLIELDPYPIVKNLTIHSTPCGGCHIIFRSAEGLQSAQRNTWRQNFCTGTAKATRLS